MNKKVFRILNILLILVVFSALSIYAKGGGDKKSSPLRKANGEPSYTKFNINSVSTWIKNDGESDINQNGNSGLVYPKGSNRAAVFQSGFLWGGKVDGQIRVGGSVYRQGTVPGRVVKSGDTWTAVNPSDPDVRIYRVRRDFATGDLSSEVQDGDGANTDEVKAQYEKDWMEWPASQGAPYEDIDANGSYDPNVDIPGVPGADQTIWFVCNDFDAATVDFMYGSLPMGIEEQATIWGYKAIGALGSMFFRKYIIINKNLQQKAFTDMYVSMWSDPDVGNASDDFAGCDTTLSMGYSYNGGATDAVYGATVPAVGFDFFQGPLVAGTPSDTAIFKGKYAPGMKNLPMTSFYFFINGDNVYTDPAQGIYETGTLGFYNLFEGKISTTGQPFVDPVTSQPTPFTLSGDPITGTGWVDGLLHAPGDRRIGMASGPFNMAYGDTQEIVVAEILAGGTAGIDRLTALTVLKDYDVAAQFAYDNFFNLPQAPQQPKIAASALDNQIIINWGGDAEVVALTEEYSKLGYEFEGYKVYQLPSRTALPSQAKLIATYDVVNDVKIIIDKAFDPVAGVPVDQVVAMGNDTGIKRYLDIKTDAFKSNLPFNNGQKYYFAVTAYAYNEAPPFGTKILENQMEIFEVIPKSADPGVRLQTEAGAAIEVAHSAGPSQGVAEVKVVDPSIVTGNKYKVTFQEDADANVTFTVTNVTTGKVKVAGAHQNEGDASPLVDGVQVEVRGPEPGILDVKELEGDVVKDARVAITPAGASLGPNGYILSNQAGDVNLPYSATDFDRFDYWGADDLIIDFSEKSLAYSYLDEVIYKSTATGEATYVPFSVYRVKFPSMEKIRLFAGFRDKDGDGLFSIDATGAYDVNWHKPTTELIFAWQGYDAAGNEIAYDPAKEAQYLAENDLFTSANITWGSSTGEFHYPFLTNTMFVMYSATAKLPDANRQVRFYTTKPNSPADVFEFTTPSVVVDPNLAKEDVEKINVFPNPYYGINSQELNKYQRFVTFNHLPSKATIRIFNLAGQLVKTIEKADPNSQFERWSLTNDSDLPVGSGLYIVHVDMPDLGTTKVLKVAIIQEQQILDRF